ncbi:MAG: hypothetical protein JO205_14600, partial [Pseudolabrys sp.]|nr:hypothetical protein [Pseudolabrys sp.]
MRRPYILASISVAVLTGVGWMWLAVIAARDQRLWLMLCTPQGVRPQAGVEYALLFSMWVAMVLAT